MNFQSELHKFVLRESNPIKHPTRGKSEINITDPSLVSELLENLLNYEIPEPTLSRVKVNFEIAFKNIIELNKAELASSLELLATNFESFIKRIAYLKYNPHYPEYWNGDGIYKGITKSSLGELLNSALYPVDSTDSSISPKPYPSPLLDFKGIKQAIYDKTREIRNHVHIAKEYSNIELISSINLVLGTYLLAIQDNKEFLSQILLPEFKLLSDKLKDEEYSRLDKLYIELSGVESLEFEITANQISDYGVLLPELDDLDDGEASESVDDRKPIIQIESIVNIANTTDGFILLGKPGAGKTTALKKIFHSIASEFFIKEANKRYPIFIDSNSYSPEFGFFKLIQNEIKGCDFIELKSKYEMVILVDGLNEINEDFRVSAVSELKYLIKNNDDITFIISSRKYGF